MAKRMTKRTVSVDSVKHKDKRKNIPTQELRKLVRADEKKPKIVTYRGLLYARDESAVPLLRKAASAGQSCQ